MRICIDAPRDNNKRFRLFLPVPLWFARLRFIWRFLPEDIRMYEPAAKEIIRILKEYRRQNGSWNLVEVDSQDTHIRIRI